MSNSMCIYVSVGGHDVWYLHTCNKGSKYPNQFGFLTPIEGGVVKPTPFRLVIDLSNENSKY